MMKQTLIIFTCLAAFCLSAFGQDKTKASTGKKVDQTYVFKCQKAKMQWDRKEIVVRPGSRIQITISNGDDLPHNMVVCLPGKTKGADKGAELAEAVLKLGDKMLEMEFIPKNHPRVIAHSGLVNPHKEKSFVFDVPKEKGNYPLVCTYPGHAQLMNAMMIVGKKPAAPPIRDLNVSVYHGAWDKLPDFSTLEPVKSGSAKIIDINAVGDRSDNFALLWTGMIDAPKKGSYTFTTSSDDGSKLWIDGKVVVDNDGVHGVTAKNGKINLEAGPHEIRVAFFERAGGEEIAVDWSGPGFKNKALSKQKVGKRGGGKMATGMPLVPPEGEASIYRNFIDGAGPRAIGVGYSEGVSLAFDANQMRLAMLWTDGFMDAARHWNGRGQGFQPPNGSNLVKFAEAAPLAVLESPEAAWPTDMEPGEPANRPVGFRFKGYILDTKTRQPSFHYEWKGLNISDQPIPLAANDGLPSLVREIHVTGTRPGGRIFYQLGKGFVADGDSHVKDETLRIRVSPKQGHQLHLVGDRLLVELKGDNLELLYEWLP